MANSVPNNVRKEVFKLVFQKASKHKYECRTRAENGIFMNQLLEDPLIGGRLREYMASGAVRTYIKDTVLNHYSKEVVKQKFKTISFEDVLKTLYGKEINKVGSINKTLVFRDVSNTIYLVHSGTCLKWETALRKVLECVAGNPQLRENASDIKMCLFLAVFEGEMSFGDESQLIDALNYIGVKAYFVK